MMQRISLLILFYLLHLSNYQVKSQRALTIPNYKSPQYTENSAVKQLSLDFQAEYFDYLVKILPNRKQELQQCSIKKISTTYLTTLTTKSLELQQNDLLKCEILDRVNEKMPILEIHTSSTTSETSDVPKFLNPRKGNCFSFRVKAKAIAEIYLYNKLFERSNGVMVASRHVIVTLGANNNTKSYMRLRFAMTCKNCDKTESTPNILDSENFNGFWISWNKTTISVGKENEEKELFSKILDIGDIEYIGLSTSGTSDHGIWYIMEPFCPSTIDQTNNERTFKTNCHKIFDKTVLNSLNISVENKLMKKIEALISEFNTEISINVNIIKDYYYKSLDELYLKEYMHLLKKCKDTKCDEKKIDMILEKFDEFRKILQNKLKILISNVNCTLNAYYDNRTEQCICKSGFIKNGNNCEKYTYKSNENLKPYYNGEPIYGDEILEQSFKPLNKQHETRYRYSTESNENVKINSYNNDKPLIYVDELEKPSYIRVPLMRPNEIKLYNLRESTTKESILKVSSPSPSPSREMSSTESTSYFQNKKEIKECKDDNKLLNCANMILPNNIRGNNCTLERDVLVLDNHTLTELEIVFFLSDSNYFYKLIWNNMAYPTFQLNELKYVLNVGEDMNGKILWKNNSAKRFGHKYYRLYINYGNNKINIRIEDVKGEVINSNSITADKIKYNTIINKLCSTSNAIQWHRIDYSNVERNDCF